MSLAEPFEDVLEQPAHIKVSIAPPTMVRFEVRSEMACQALEGHNFDANVLARVANKNRNRHTHADANVVQHVNLLRRLFMHVMRLRAGFDFPKPVIEYVWSVVTVTTFGVCAIFTVVVAVFLVSNGYYIYVVPTFVAFVGFVHAARLKWIIHARFHGNLADDQSEI